MSQPASTSRRDFLRASVFASAVFGAESSLTAQETRKASVNNGQARNVIFMVSDGMNHGALSLARMYREVAEGKGTTHWTQMYRERPVVRSLVETFSANSVVTDSAAAASAWGGGQRVNNGALNVLPDGNPTTTIHQLLHEAGLGTGLVTTATITHATPAGFAINLSSRGKEAEIAQQYLDRRVDVLLGGGTKFFSEALREAYVAAGYDLSLNRDHLLGLRNDQLKPLLGIFSDSHIPFSIDRSHVPSISSAVPSLSEMTQVALDRLSKTRNGFFLMVEGARIDHAGHQNDAAASIHDQLAFDDAIGTALKFVDANPDTLLVITTDHGCGGIQMNGMNVKVDQEMAPGIYSGSTLCFKRLQGFTRSFEWMKQQGLDGLSGGALGGALKEFTGLDFTEEQLKKLQGLKLAGAQAFQEHHGVGWTSGNHTGDLVELCAFGPGSKLFPAFLQNREVHDLVLNAMNLKPGA